MAAMDYSVREAAGALGVSDRRIRAMIREEILPGRRSGGRWLVRRVGVELRKRRGGKPGRPLSHRNAWALVSKLSGNGWPALSAWDRSRLERKLERGSLLSLADQLGRRAEPRLFRADSRVLDDIRSDPALVRSGVSAAREYGLDVRAPGIVEAYAQRDYVDQLVYRYSLQPADVVDANVVLHVVNGPVPRSADDVAPLAAVALDLIESGDARSQRAGRELARRTR